GGRMTQDEAYEAFKARKPFPSIGDQRARSGTGVAKTHEIFIAFGPTGREVLGLVAPFDKPLFAQATPSYYARTAALGRFHPHDPKNFPVLEDLVERHLTWIWRHQNEWSKWLGVFDYGDTLSVFDRSRGEWWVYDGGRWGWLNGEVDADQ